MMTIAGGSGGRGRAGNSQIKFEWLQTFSSLGGCLGSAVGTLLAENRMGNWNGRLFDYCGVSWGSK